MLETWRRRAARPRLWAGAGALALIVGVCGADAQSSLTLAAPDNAPAGYARGRAGSGLSAAESARFKQAIDYAQAGDTAQAQAIRAGLSDPLARRVVLWAMIDSAGSNLDFATLDQAQADLASWPRGPRRLAVAEKALDASGLSPKSVSDWFASREPATPEGAMALASARRALGRIDEAQTGIRRFWRERSFGPDVQAAMLARFGIYLTAEDHAARLSMLLYGGAGPSARAMLALVDADHAALAQARMALRADWSEATSAVARVPATLQGDGGLAFDRARYLRKRNLDTLAVGYLKDFPSALPSQETASVVWAERRALMMAALRSGDPRGAYAAVTRHGLTGGADFTEAEFFAGWIALNKLKDPALADRHFGQVQTAGVTPITLSRAYYWRGRAAAARGDAATAQQFWRAGARYPTAFYGQLSSERAGITQISLGRDPTPTAMDRDNFENRDLVRAARMLGDIGEKEAFRAFVLTADDVLPTAAELALLVDMARLYGDQDLSMRVVRTGAQRGLILPERGYPVRVAPRGDSLPEPAFTLAITRQESGFDPRVRSPVGARGLMQLMPGTAAGVARRIGVGYSAGQLDEPGYNMRLGAAYLGQVIDSLGGNYLMAAAAYNAGPGRAQQWAAECGDPRQSSVDPADYIECIPFTETRNYVMRIMENLQVYHARLNGGSAALTLTADLHRGGWTPTGGLQQAADSTAGQGAISQSR